MHRFDYLKPADMRTATATALANPGARYLAGGTNLVDLMKEGAETPPLVIDIADLPDLSAIAPTADGGLRLGTLAKNSDVAADARVRARYPVLSQALLASSSGQIRNMATVGGNMLQRTRCWYFVKGGYPCNKRSPGTGCAAIAGINREHAVLGGSPACIATHASDMTIALAALDATVVVAGAGGERRIPFTDFHVVPGNTPHLETVLDPGDLIVAVDLPPTPWARRSHYLKLRDRASYQFALASAAVALDLDAGRIRAARIALGGVGTKPWRAFEAERTLVGRTAGEPAYRAAAEIAMRDARPLKHNRFKVELAKGAIVRALLSAGDIA